MTALTAKLVSLRVVSDWESRKVWAVRQKLSDNTATYRWYRSEDNARRYAALVSNATVEQHESQGEFALDDELTDLRQRVALALADRGTRMRELGYSHESARG